MKKCPNGHIIDDNTNFCPTCGAKVSDDSTKHCANCGNEIEGTENFCSQCGLEFNASRSCINNSLTSKSSKKSVTVVFVVFAMLILGGIAWYIWEKQKENYSLEGLAKAVVNYDSVDCFYEGLAKVTKNKMMGYIDKKGNEIIPCIYDDLGYGDFDDGLAIVCQGDKIFFINTKGEKIIELNYDNANSFSEGLAKVVKDNKNGFIDTNGNEVIALTDKYKYYDFSEGVALVKKNEKYGYIDKKGRVVIECKYDDAFQFHDGLARVLKNDKYGYIDKKGDVVIDYKYDSAFDFIEGLAIVKINDKYGCIDKTGKIVIECIYNWIYGFSEGLSQVEKNGKYYVIDKNGKEIFQCSSYQIWSRFNYGLAIIRSNDKDDLYGVIDTQGKVIIPCKYKYISDYSEGLAVVKTKEGLYGYIDKNGNSTFDVESEEVKKYVNTKIYEKEEIRKEEEMKRQEEEKNRWGFALYNLASNSTPKQIAFSCQKEYDKNTLAWLIVTYAVYLYPYDEKSGVAHFVEFFARTNSQDHNQWVEDWYGSYATAENSRKLTTYQIIGKELYFSDNAIGLIGSRASLIFDIADDGNSLTLKCNGMYFKRGVGARDPFN